MITGVVERNGDAALTETKLSIFKRAGCKDRIQTMQHRQPLPATVPSLEGSAYKRAYQKPYGNTRNEVPERK